MAGKVEIECVAERISLSTEMSFTLTCMYWKPSASQIFMTNEKFSSNPMVLTKKELLQFYVKLDKRKKILHGTLIT